MLQLNIRIDRPSASGLTRNGKCSKQNIEVSSSIQPYLLHKTSVPGDDPPLSSPSFHVNQSNNRWKTRHFRLHT
jgi:hypothetical protein